MQTVNQNVKIFYELQRIQTAWLPESRNHNEWTITPLDFFKNKLTNRYWNVNCETSIIVWLFICNLKSLLDLLYYDFNTDCSHWLL